MQSTQCTCTYNFEKKEGEEEWEEEEEEEKGGGGGGERWLMALTNTPTHFQELYNSKPVPQLRSHVNSRIPGRRGKRWEVEEEEMKEKERQNRSREDQKSRRKKRSRGEWKRSRRRHAKVMGESYH